MNRYIPQYNSKERYRSFKWDQCWTPLSVENNFLFNSFVSFNKIVNAWNDLSGNVVTTQVALH